MGAQDDGVLYCTQARASFLFISYLCSSFCFKSCLFTIPNEKKKILQLGGGGGGGPRGGAEERDTIISKEVPELLSNLQSHEDIMYFSPRLVSIIERKQSS